MEQKEFVWKDMSLQEKNLFAAMYGQVHLGDNTVFEAGVSDVRFTQEDSIPWDAVASVLEDGRLALAGMTEPSGGGHWMAIRLPTDVKVFMHVWESPPRKPDVPDLVKIQKYLRSRMEAMEKEVREASAPDSQGILMDHDVCEVLSELSYVIIRNNLDDGVWDDDSCLGAMVALAYVVDAISNHKWGEIIENFTIPLEP